MNRIIDEFEGDIDILRPRALEYPTGVVEKRLVRGCGQKQRRQQTKIAEQWRDERIARLVILEVRCRKECQVVSVCGRILAVRKPESSLGGVRVARAVQSKIAAVRV